MQIEACVNGVEKHALETTTALWLNRHRLLPPYAFGS